MNKIKLMIITLLLLILFLTSCSKNHISEDFKKLVEQNYIIESTVLIIKEESFSQNNGVIFNKEINKYYVLTAYHTIESFEGNLYVLFWDVSRYNDLNAQDKIGIGRYYESKPKATIEYTNIEFDLAILSFESEDTLPTLEFSDLDPNYGDEVIVISNPENKERNHISYGNIISKEYVPFGDENDYFQHKVIEHSAYIGPGSSGSVLINNNLKIVGINIGGSVNLFGKFKKGKAMPVSRVNEFIELYKEL